MTAPTKPRHLTILGFTGNNDADDWALLQQARHEFAAAVEAGTPGRVARLERLIWALGATRYHNAAVPAGTEFHQLHHQAHAAMTAATSEYDDLSRNTTVNWLAAHHRFVTATITARDLLERKIRAAEDIHAVWDTHMNGLTFSGYHDLVDPTDRITPPDLDQLRLELATWIETSTTRFTITRITVTGGYPAGFAPTTDTPATDGTPDSPDTTFTAGQAIANTARRW